MSDPVFPPALASLIAEMQAKPQNAPQDPDQVRKALRRAMLVVSLPSATPAHKIRALLRKADGKEPFYIHLIVALGIAPHPDDVLVEVRSRCVAQVVRAKAGEPDLSNVYLAMLAEDALQFRSANPVLYSGLLELIADTAWKVRAAVDAGIPIQKPAPEIPKPTRRHPLELNEVQITAVVSKLCQLDQGNRTTPSHFDVFQLYAIEGLTSTSPDARRRRWAASTIRKRKRHIEESIFLPVGDSTPLEKMRANAAVFNESMRQEEDARKHGARVRRPDLN